MSFIKYLIEVGYNKFTSSRFFYSEVLPNYVEQNPSREVNVRWASFVLCSEVHNSVRKNNLPYPLLNQINPVNMIHFFKTSYYILYSYSERSLPSRFFYYTLVSISCLGHSATCSALLISLFGHPNDVRWRVQIMWLHIMSLSNPRLSLSELFSASCYQIGIISVLHEM